MTPWSRAGWRGIVGRPKFWSQQVDDFNRLLQRVNEIEGHLQYTEMKLAALLQLVEVLGEQLHDVRDKRYDDYLAGLEGVRDASPY